VTPTLGPQAAVASPIVVAGAIRDAPPGVVTALLLGGVAFVFFVFM
jgi:hypothetical protein